VAEWDLDPESVKRAETLSSRLMDDLHRVSEQGSEREMRRELFSEQRYSEWADGTPISDVVTNVGQMAMEFAMLRRSGGDVPCLKLNDGQLAPISLAEFFGGGALLPFGSENWLQLFDRYFGFPGHFWREIFRRSWPKGDGFVATKVGEAEGAIKRSLSGFLSYRFAGMRKWAEWIQGAGIRGFGGPNAPARGKRPTTASFPPPPAVGAGGGLQVQVSCLTPRLRIHISPAYFVSWVYFGSPTTPVANYVLPGRYIFAGEGPMLPKRKRDLAVFCIPADYHPALTRF